jgi:hypothetical protein
MEKHERSGFKLWLDQSVVEPMPGHLDEVFSQLHPLPRPVAN